MTGWTALVPLKSWHARKSRLQGALSPDDRLTLSDWMARHVVAQLRGCSAVVDIVVLSPCTPSWWRGAHAADGGRGLNDELQAWRAAWIAAGSGSRLLLIHGDLALLTSKEVSMLLEVAERSGIALATDRAGTGTNALALRDDAPFAFRFGPGSRALHARQAPHMPVVALPGLATDIDTPADLAFLPAGAMAGD